MTQPLLSVCIPTYNRCQYLKELIDSILSIERDDIEVVVKDCASTDGTVEMLKSILDPRLRVYWNANDLPAFCNMVDSLFCAQGKYALFCLDRDILFPDKVIELMRLISQDDYSLLVMTSVGNNTQDLKVYNQGFESLMMQNNSHHPTGMVFNMEIAKVHLNKNDYFKHLDDIYTWDFLMRDLLRYKKSAIFDCGGWKQRPQEFKRTHRAGTQKKGDLFWFYPQFWVQYARAELKQLFSDVFALSDEEKKSIAVYVLKSCINQIIGYKFCLGSPDETAHYGIQMKFVTTVELVKCYIESFQADTVILKQSQCNNSAVIVKEWRKYFMPGLFRVVVRSLRMDVRMLKRAIFQRG